jgi:hypothetical protein
MTTPSLPLGTYRIEFTTLHNATAVNAAPRVQVRVDNTVLFDGGYFAAEVKDPNATRFEHYCSSDIFTGSGVLPIYIEYRRIGGNATPETVSIHYSSITIWRVQ